MTERSDVAADGTGGGTDGSAVVDDDDDDAVVTIVTDDDTVTFAVRSELEQGGSTTEWISMDAENVVDVGERQ
jgi:hypothetical protein